MEAWRERQQRGLHRQAISGSSCSSDRGDSTPLRARPRSAARLSRRHAANAATAAGSGGAALTNPSAAAHSSGRAPAAHPLPATPAARPPPPRPHLPPINVHGGQTSWGDTRSFPPHPSSPLL